MKNKLEIKDLDKTKKNKLPRLTRLNLEQIDGLSGGWAKPGHFSR